VDIFNSLGEISKNSANFKKWEDEQERTEAKRSKIAKIKPSTPEELQRAKELGKTIIDVVDIMDQHSENIAENVETATTIPLSLAPFVALLGGGFLSGKFVINPASEKISKLQKEYLAQHREALDKVLEAISKNSPKKKNLSVYHLLNPKITEKLDIPHHLKSDVGKIAKGWNELTRVQNYKMKLGVLVPIAATIGTFIAGNIYTTKMQVDSSKIARFQARKILEDPKYFAKYSAEQIAKAEQILSSQSHKEKSKKELKTDKLKSGMFKSFINILKDQKAYKKWKANDKDESQKVTRVLSEAETIKAKKDQEVIQRVVRKVNNNAEVYSQNMEVASAVLIGGTPLLGLAIGKIVSTIMEFTKIIPKYVDKQVAKYGSEEAKKAYKDLIAASEKSPNYKKLFLNFFNKMNEVEVDKLANPSTISKFMNKAKTLVPVALSTKIGRTLTLGAVVFMITETVGLGLALKLQKAASRVGRYTAKRELEKDPHNFIGYTDEELNNVQESDKKKKPNKLKEYLLFLPNVIKQYIEYKKYEKNELRHDKLLQEELVKMEISDRQLNDAKNLQRKVFNTFEKVDDNSQTYSESVEMAIDIAEPFVYTGATMLTLSPLIVFLVQAARGKVTAKSITNKLLTSLSGATWLTKQKFFKTYLNDIAKGISKSAQSMPEKNTALNKLLSQLDIKNMVKNKKNLTVADLCEKLETIFKKESKNSIKIDDLLNELNAMPIFKENKELQGIFENLGEDVSQENLLTFIAGIKESMGEQKIISFLDKKGNLSKMLSGKMNSQQALSMLDKEVQSMSNEKFKKMMEKWAERLNNVAFINKFDLTSIDKTYAQASISKIQKIINNLPSDELKNIINTCINEFSDHPEQFMAYLKSNKLPITMLTPGLQKTLGAVGISWTVFSFGLTYLLESYLADIKLKAGRLGVMKALEGLKDPAYYANIEPDSGMNNKPKQNSNLISNYKGMN